jgi:hypothetical protein
MPGVGGTGRLARRVAAEIEGRGLGRSQGVTRHQFFDGPGVPKTARNSAAAIVFDGVASMTELLARACEVVTAESIAGSDPGVALVAPQAHRGLVEFARAAQTGLVRQAEARDLAAAHGVRLAGLGGTEDGVIGALGAVALRVEGNDGRFVDLPGIRDVAGVMTVAAVLERTSIAEVVGVDGAAPPPREAELDLGDWVRPRLQSGRPVVAARRHAGRWVNADARPR